MYKVSDRVDIGNAFEMVHEMVTSGTHKRIPVAFDVGLDKVVGL